MNEEYEYDGEPLESSDCTNDAVDNVLDIIIEYKIPNEKQP